MRPNQFQQAHPSGLSVHPCVTFFKASALGQTGISIPEPSLKLREVSASLPYSTDQTLSGCLHG